MENQDASSSNAANQTPSQENQEPKVELDAGQYAALLDRIAELEAQNDTRPYQPPANQPDDLDTLADEANRVQTPTGQQAELSPRDLDEMSGSQLAEVILNAINSQGGQRLDRIESAVESLRIMREIDKVEAKHDDFWSYEERTREIAMENPSLSIERAYKLAKEELGPIDDANDANNQRGPTRTERMLRLPKVPQGEKPGAPVGAMHSAKKDYTVRGAAEEAWDEVVGAGKTEI